MILRETEIPGVFEIELEVKPDERGFFARTWCQKEFATHGLSPKLVQCSVSFNPRKGTLRGLHYQAALHAETKLVRCTRGAIYDVVLDLRPHSSKFKLCVGEIPTAENTAILYVTNRCPHGSLT